MAEPAEIRCALRTDDYDRRNRLRVAYLPDGKRRTTLNDKFEQFIAQALAQRVVNYDELAARVYGEIMGMRKESGRPMSVPEGQTAAIARCNHPAVAARNNADFEACGVELIDLFASAG